MPQASKNKPKTKAKVKDTNPDPITGEPGAHPVGVGLGTAAGGAAAGALAGALGGPVGVVVGAVAGGVAGAFAGKAAAEAIDPTGEEEYWRKNYRRRPYVAKGDSYDTYRPAYRYGVEAQQKHAGRSFDEAEADLRKGWSKASGDSGLAWDNARGAVRDAYERTIQLREEKLHARKEQKEAGEVRVRKEVVTEHKTIKVPVEREEIVIERRPTSRRATSGDFRAEEVRVPLRQERARAEKETRVKEEITVGKRTVQDTQKVSGTVRKERLRVEETGKARARHEPAGRAKR